MSVLLVATQWLILDNIIKGYFNLSKLYFLENLYSIHINLFIIFIMYHRHFGTIIYIGVADVMFSAEV